MEFGSPEFWVAVLQIIAIDIVLSGDNAVVIALACRSLPPQQRRKGIFWGVTGAISLRVILTFFAVTLLDLPYLKAIGAALLLWIGVKLMLPDKPTSHDIPSSESLIAAIKTIIIADFVMSLDNVVAVAAAADGSILLLIFGLIVSIPLIVWGSQLILRFMDRYPIIITLGAGLLGWVAGDMAVSDPVIQPWAEQAIPFPEWTAALAGALFVAVVGTWLKTRTKLVE
ncbi:MAG: TerC family protein [Burkholderiales bacterium]|nr:TerC family protein [Burkholderiales bacterium]MDQ3197101.1 TerC family protein [Pseudomonadota bacterium]